MYSNRWEERAAEYISQRNNLVRGGMQPNAYLVNSCEERAANALSRAKRA